MKLPKVYRRPVYAEILERAHEPRRFIQVLAGPRQVDFEDFADVQTGQTVTRIVIGNPAIRLAALQATPGGSDPKISLRVGQQTTGPPAPGVVRFGNLFKFIFAVPENAIAGCDP